MHFFQFVAVGEYCRTPANLNGYCMDTSQCKSFNALAFSGAPLAECSNSEVCCPLPFNPKSSRTLSEPQGKLFQLQPRMFSTPDSELNSDSCGEMRNINKIAQGKNASVGEFPFMVLLQYSEGVDGEEVFNCAGTLITPRYVLTAAHCITSSL